MLVEGKQCDPRSQLAPMVEIPKKEVTAMELAVRMTVMEFL
jgi:hypothetical protein